MTDPQHPLTLEEAAVFDRWFGPASDGMSEAVRRAIRDELANLDTARKASPPLDVERVLWADHLTTDHPTTPCYHDRAKVVMPGRVEAVAREYAALDPTP